MLKGKVYINEQEQSGNYKFAGVKACMTLGFQETFQEEARAVAFTALALILEKYPDNADYLQTFEYRCEGEEAVRFWCINDIERITFLMPDEY